MNISDLTAEYLQLFSTCEILPDHERHPISLAEVKEFCAQLLVGRAQYEQAQASTTVPWFVVGLIHGMECSFSFHQHLHNGDPLTARTVQVPAGRPVVGEPPFQWLDSAIDALRYDDFVDWPVWDVTGICFKLEGYNGFGSRRHGINSSYLWSGSTHYSTGKYIADGVWSPTAVSKQVGAIVALKYLVEQHEVALPAQPVDA